MYACISPWNIWRLQYSIWLGFAASADHYMAELERVRREQHG